MTPSLNPPRRGKGLHPADTSRLRQAFYRSIPKSIRYQVESLEPRYLLSGTPVDLTDHTKTATNNQTDGTKIAAELTSIIGKLSYLGQQIDKTSIDNPLTESVIPLLNETVDQITKSGTSGFTLGQMLFSDSSVATALGNKISTDFTNATAGTPTTNLTSATLATDLQTLLQADFGTGFTVADNSTTGSQLDLHFAFTSTTSAITTPIVLGNAAQEFNLSLVQTAAGGPQANANLTATTTVSFDIKADYSTTPSDTSSVVNELKQFDSSTINSATLQTDLDTAFTFNPNTIEQTALVSEEGVGAGGYLPAFGVQFGVMGAGENDANAKVDGAYANNATFDLDVDAKVDFNASSYTVATLKSAESAATASSPYIPYSVDTPVGNTIAGSHALTNEATLTLPITVYDDGQIGAPTSGTTEPTNDATYISGLGGLTGTFTVQDSNLFGATSFDSVSALPAASAPLVNADSVELASFARLTATSIVGMAQSSSYLAGEIDSLRLTSDLPFLNLTQGEAYDFATALQNAFVNAIQSTQIILTATNEPSTVDAAFPSGNPLNLTGSTSFKIDLDTGSGASLHAYQLNVSLPANSGRTTMTELVADLNTALTTALGAAGLSTTQPEIQARLQTNSSGTQLIQLYSSDPTAQYFLFNFATSATGIIDLGFNQSNNVVAQAPLSITGTTPATFQVPGVIVGSSTAINGNTSFTVPTSFNVSVNGGPAVTVTIPPDAYSETTLVAAVQQALITANLWDGISQDGVLVQGVPIGSGGGFGLEFYGGNDVHSLSITSAGSSSNYSALNITTSSSTAASFNVAVTSHGVTTTTTVYVNGNLTNGLLNFQQANQSATDLVSDLQQALIQAGVLNSSQTMGVSVSSTTDSSGHPVLQFIAANPGTGVGQISNFTISSIGSAFSGLIGTGTITSQNIALAISSTTPAFQTVQQLASLLYNLNLNGTTGANADGYFGILSAAPSYSVGDLTSSTGSPSFNFPIDIRVSDTSILNGSTVLPDLTGVGLSFASIYDTVSNLSSGSTITIQRADNMSFAFGFNLIAPTTATEVLTTSLPVSQLFTSYFLNTQGVIQFTPDNGVTYTVTLPANTTGSSTSLSGFLAALNLAIGSATSNLAGAPALTTYLQNSATSGPAQYVTTTTDPNTGAVSLVFTTKPGSTRELTITVPANASTTSTVNDAAWYDLGLLPNTTSTTPFTYTSGAAGDPITATFAVGAQINGTALSVSNPYTLTTTGFITFNLPDGTQGTVEIDPVDTSGDTTLDKLVQTINNDISATASLKGTSWQALQQVALGNISMSQVATDVLPKIIVTESGGNLVFSLNPNVFQTNAAWSLTVRPTYLQDNPNSLAVDIGLPSQTVVDSAQTSLGVLSGALSSPLSLSGADSFKVSIDGQNYVTVSVNLNGVTTVGGLVQAINAGIAAAPNVSFNGIAGSFALANYLTADATNGGTQVLIRLIDDGVKNDYGSGSNASLFPVLENAALQLTSSTGALATTLGFSNQQLLFTIQGADGTIKAVSFAGTASEVNASGKTGATFTGTAAFGFTDFNIAQGLLNEQARTNVTFSPGQGATIDDLLADANTGNFTSADFGGGISAAPVSSSYAVVTLQQLSFPTSLATGLSFGTNAQIEFGYGTFSGFTGPTIASFDTLPTITSSGIVYTNTNNMQLLTRLDLASIVHGVERVGDMLSDWMQNGTGPFNAKLFFTLQSLLGIDNFGQDLANAAAQVLSAPPSSLEATPAALVQALQIDPSALTFAIQSTGSGSTAQVVLNLSFDWAKAIAETLPLAVDLASLANNVSTSSTYVNLQGQTEFYSSGVINQFLLGLSTIESDPVNPININFAEVSQVAVNLDLIAAQNGVAIQPQAVIQNPTTGSFFQTRFLLDGDNLTGNLPAGSGYLLLNNGSFGIDATGQLDGSTSVLTVATSNLTYNSATNTITGTGALGGYTIVAGDIGSDILINGQSTAAQNGLYQVTGFNAATSTWTLTQETAIGSVGTAARFHVENGTSANLFFGLAGTGSSQFSLQAPLIYDVAAVSTFNPATLQVLAATTAPITATATATTLTGTGPLVIDSYTVQSSDAGSYVLINTQTNPTQNGLYTVTSAGGSSWTLTRSTVAVAQTRLQIQHGSLNTGLFFGYDTPTQFAQLIEPATYTYSLAASETLPYTVQAATTSDLGSSATFSPGTIINPATLTGTAGVSINNLQTTATDSGQALNFTGIDNVQTLKVGSLVLVKNQTAQNQNGVYVVTTVGGTDSSGNPVAWVLTRADFAKSLSTLSGVRIAVATGYENAGTRWVQSNTTLTTGVLDSSNVTFSNNVTSIYSTVTTTGGGTTLTTPWLTFAAAGQAGANLPLEIVFVTSGGSEVIIGNDLQNAQQQVTIGNLKAFYTSLNTIDGSTVTLANLIVAPADTIHGNLLYSDFSAFKPLTFNFSLSNYFAAGGSGSVHFTYVPDIFDSFVSPSVIAAFQDAFYVGDALDLALFTIQSSIAEALAQEFPLVGTSLSGEAEFVENFRSQFTTLVRQGILANSNFPLEDIRNAIYTAALNEGLLANLTLANGTPAQATLSENSIEVDVISGGVATAFPFGDFTNTNYYGKNSNGTLFETVPGGATAITFAFTLQEIYSSAYTTTLQTIDLGDSSIGATITTSTTGYTSGASTTGGINLQRKFVFNFGFGIDTTAGFFIFNPTEASDLGLKAAPMVDFGFKAELTGNINDTSGNVDPFFQNTYSSQVNGLSVEVSDGRIIDQLLNESTTGQNLNGSTNDNLPSGFYGDVLFDLNLNHPSGDANAVTLGFLNGRYANVEDLRSTPELGPDTTTSSVAAGSLFSFIINADADVDLQLQSQQQGLQPATQADLIYDKSYGAGAIGFGLIFNNTAVVGLGNAALGQQELTDQANANSSDPTVAANALTDFDTIATQVSPIWRFANRDLSTSLLLANGAQGNTFLDYQNIKINIIDYLGNVLYSALKLYEEIVSPLRPYITFLTTPIPGTTAFTSSGITVGTLLGSKFETFISDVQAIDALISPLSSLAAEDSSGSGWVAAPATSIDLSGLFAGAEYLGGKVADKIGEKVKEKYDEYQKKKQTTESEAETTSQNEGVAEDSSASSSASRAQQAEADVNKTSGTSDSTSESFNKFKEGNSSTSEGTSNKEEDTKEDSGESEKKSKGSFSAGLTGGNILLDALDFNTITNIYEGVNTNLLRIQLPSLNVSYTYTKEIPIEAFPPLVITLGFTIGFDVNINFGWDTKGFFFNTVDLTTGAPLPLFDFTGKFSVGIGLDFGLINVEADVFFQATVSFFWNDVSGTGKLHESDLQYLTSHNDSIFAVEITGAVGFDFSIVLSIPIPLVGPINITIFTYTYSITLFDVTFGAVTGQMQLGTVETGADGQGDVLLLNSGIYAAQRLFNNTDPVNESFTLYDVGGSAATGENILVEFDNQYYEEFDGIKQVIGYTGTGSSQIDAGAALAVGSGLTLSLFTTGNSSTTKTYTTDLQPLKYAVLDFFGGAGDTVLRAGAGYNSAWGRSRLQGGTGTGTELLEANVTLSGITDPGVDIIAGGGPATIYGSVGNDNIVAGQGPDLIFGTANDHFFFESGFGNDRIYVTGGNNAVSFDGWILNTVDTGSSSTTGNTTTVADPILTTVEIAEFITGLNVAPITTPLTFSFGPLVESAVTGNSTVFFATDPTETQQIDSWTGGVGGDTYNIFYFAPDQTLTLNAPVESNHVNTFNIFFGNPNIVYIDVIAENMGTINLNDTNNQDVLNVDQTFPETVNSITPAAGYTAAYANGRELLNYDTNLLVNYNAPNSTIVLGNPNDTTDFDPIKVGTYNVGTIVLVSPIEFTTSNVVIKLKNTLDVLYDINIVGTSVTPASLEIDITNAFPTGESDITFESGAVLGISSVSRANQSAAGADDLGYGTITLNINSGSLKDINEVNGIGGLISLINGTLVISALTSIGSPNDVFNTIAGQFVAQTTGRNDVSGNNGIYVKSPDDLHITASGNMNGLSTAAGDIFVDVSAGHTLYYYQINAGTAGAGSLGGNVTLIADSIQPITSFSVTRDVATQEAVTQQVVTITPVFNLINFELALLFGGFDFFAFLPLFFTYSIQVTNVVVGYQVVEVPTQFTVGGTSGPNADSITGTGTLSLWNATSGAPITVADQTTAPTSGLYLTSAFLNEITAGFAAIEIGRASTDATSTGDITINPYIFNQASNVIFQGNSLDVNGNVTNEHASLVNSQLSPDGQLVFKAYGTPGTSTPAALDGHLTFNPAGTYTADTISISTQADLDLKGTFLSKDANAGLGDIALANGAIQIVSQGAVTIDTNAKLQATVGQSSISITGTSITIQPTATILASDNLTLIASAGSIADASLPSNRAKSANLILQATQGISLDVDTLSIESATTTTGNIFLNNDDTGQLVSGALNVASITTSISPTITTTGTITLVNAGNIDLVRGTLITTPLIQTGILAGDGVALTSTSGAITGDTNYNISEVDIKTNSLSLHANGAIGSGVSSTLSDTTLFFGLITQASALAAASTGGAITIGNVGPVTLGDVTTSNQAISIYDTDNIAIEGTVGSGGQPILLDTHRLAGNGGSILLGLAAASPNPGVQGTVDAGTGAVTLTADDAILGAAGFNRIAGSAVTLTAWGNQLVNSAANALISVKLATPTVDATTNKPGKIVLDTNEDLLLHNIQTPLGGDIDVTAESATLGGPGVNLVTYDVNAFSSNVNLTADGSITDDTTDTNLSNDIVAATLTTQSVGDTVLKTDISNLFSYVGGTGSLTVNQGSSLQVDSAVTNNGAININAGQNSTVGHLTNGNIFLGTITAGNSSAVNLDAIGGFIQDPTFGMAGDTSLLTGGIFTATTQSGIHGINTAISQLDATSTAIGSEITIAQTGDILVDNVTLSGGGDMTLTASNSNSTTGTITVKNITTDTINSDVKLTSISGAIDQQVGKIIAATLDAVAATGITALTDINYLNADVTGIAGGPITITQDHGLTIGQVQTQQGSFDLTLVTGGVTASNQPLQLPYNVEANTIDIISPTGVAAGGQPLNVYADSIDVTADSPLGTGIFIHNYKIHTGPDFFIADQILAATGPVSVSSAGNLLARDIEIQADKAGNDITLVSTNGGDTILNFVGTGLSDAVIGVTAPKFGNVNVTSDGLINAVDPAIALHHYPANTNHAVNIVANGTSFDAQTGIGTPASLTPIITGKLLSAKTKTGDINSGDSSSSDFFISGFQTGHGNLGFIMGGSGNLHATGFVTLGGNVILTVHDSATLFLGSIFAIGNVSLQMDHINFQGGTDSVFGTGTLVIQSDNSNQFVQINSHFAQTIFERSDTLEIGLIGFEAFFTSFQSIFIGNFATPNRTYTYYDVADPFLDGAMISGTTITFGDTETSGYGLPTGEFQLADLLAVVPTKAYEGQLTAGDIQAIVDEIDQTGDFGDTTSDDSSGTEDFFFSDAGNKPSWEQAGGEIVSTGDSNPAALKPGSSIALEQAPTTPAEDDASWIDRALVITTAATAVTRPLRKILGLF